VSASKKQIRANRANAKKSTGPKTPEGKRTSSRNATTHGLYSRDLIVDSPHLKENQAEYDLILTALKVELKPEGVLQGFLVRKIANCLWRSGRVVRAESAQIKRQLHFLSDSLPRNIAIGVESIPQGEAAKDISRYELRLERQLARTLNLLMRLKKSRSSSLSDPLMEYVTRKLPDLPPDLENAAIVGGPPVADPHLPHVKPAHPVPAGLSGPTQSGPCDLPVSHGQSTRSRPPHPVPAGLSGPTQSGPCDLPDSDEDSDIVGPPKMSK